MEPGTAEEGLAAAPAPAEGTASPQRTQGTMWKLVHPYQFENVELERLYKRYVYKLQQTSIVYLLLLFILLTLSLAILHFVHQPRPTVRGLYQAGQCIVLIALFIYILTPLMHESHFSIVCYILLVFLLLFSAMAFPVSFGEPGGQDLFSPPDGVWEIMFVIFMIYSMMPLRTYVALMFGLLIPVCHLAVSPVIANTFPELLWRQVSQRLLVIGFIRCLNVIITSFMHILQGVGSYSHERRYLTRPRFCTSKVKKTFVYRP